MATLVDCEDSRGTIQEMDPGDLDVVWCRCINQYFTEEAHDQIPCRCLDEDVLDWESDTGLEYSCMEDKGIE